MTEELKDAEREAFEAWAKGKFNLTPLAGAGDFFYERENTQSAWSAWQESRRAALDEAAKTVGALHEKISAQEIIGFDAWSAGHLALNSAAFHIRALCEAKS
jgi:hypothetical protein